jgi:class 3 adenylate cyclase
MEAPDTNGVAGIILFADLVGFTSISRRLTPSHLVEILNKYFSALDETAEKFGVQKIKTIGDSYMAASGLNPEKEHAPSYILDMALEIIEVNERISREEDLSVSVRVGVATGHVVSGVLGIKLNQFDVWGGTVNVASRMESTGVENLIQVSEPTYWRFRNRFSFIERGDIDVRGFGKMKTYLVEHRIPEKVQC